MKKIYFALLLTVFCTASWGQTAITPVVLASSSVGYGDCSSLNINYTVGEMAIVTAGSPGAVNVTEGFEQPVTTAYEQLVHNLPGCITAIEEVNIPAISFSLFPNPVSQTCWIRFVAPENGSTEFLISDIMGKKLSTTKSNSISGSNEAQIDVSQLSSGAYLLTLKFTNQAGINYQSVKDFSVIN
jgi:hypothetical protein